MKKELKQVIDSQFGDGDGVLTFKDGAIIIIKVLSALFLKKV